MCLNALSDGRKQPGERHGNVFVCQPGSLLAAVSLAHCSCAVSGAVVATDLWCHGTMGSLMRRPATRILSLQQASSVPRPGLAKLAEMACMQLTTASPARAQRV